MSKEDIMSKIKFLTTILLLAGTAFVFAAGSGESTETGDVIVDDALIETRLENQLEWDTRVFDDNISVYVDDGIVTLTGTVPSYQSRRYAETDAWLMDGVIEVNNDITVIYPEPTPADGIIKENTETVIQLHPDLEEQDITVSVDDQVVTLEGSVDSYWKKLEAGDVAQNSYGTTLVINNLEVTPGESVVDDIIEQDILDAFDRNPYVVELDGDNVQVIDGKVTLSGTVDDWYERFTAQSIAAQTLGVIEVENNLIIE